MGYGHVTKLMHVLRIHQSFISESFTNHTHQTSEQLSNWAIEFKSLRFIEII